MERGNGYAARNVKAETVEVARASRPLGRGHPARAFLVGAGRSHDSGRDARATSALSHLCGKPIGNCALFSGYGFRGRLVVSKQRALLDNFGRLRGQVLFPSRRAILNGG